MTDGYTQAIEHQLDEAKAEIARLRDEADGIRSSALPDRFRCCECCQSEHLADAHADAEDDLIDNHSVPCSHCQDPWRARAEGAEAKVSRVEALARRLAENPTFAHWPRQAAALIRAALDGTP